MAKELIFSKPINVETMTELMEKIGEEKEVTILLHSSGGDPSAAILFHSYVETKKINLTVHVMAKCESAAIIILCAAKRRLGSKNSTYLLHLLKRTYEGKVTLSVQDLRREADDLELMEKILREIVYLAVDRNHKEMIPIYEAERDLTAAEAFQLGLLTEEPK